MDFIFKAYEKLLTTLLQQGFSFLTVSSFFKTRSESKPFIMLRHDVEAMYGNALKMAVIQHEMGIQGTYYFRIFPDAQNMRIIKSIAEMGHEIGYHYDDLSVCNGNHEKAIQRFENNLLQLRKIAPVQSITMEGAPLSKYDNRDLWKHYKYKDFGITNEPYFDLDFDQIFYLTDTGRRWDGDKFNVRDKPMKMSGERVSCERVSCERVSGERVSCERVSCEQVSCERVSCERVSGERVSCERVSGERVSGERVSCEQVIDEIHRYHNIGDVGNETIRGNYLAGNRKDGFTNPEFLKLRFRHTSDIINAVNEGTFPKQAMLNFHPQRWNDAFVPWVKELVWQNVKNQGKRLLKAVRDER